MSKLTGSIFLLLIASALCFSQAQPKSVASTKWERYGVPDQKATVLLPKLPAVLASGSTCRGEKGSDYGAYADGAAYVVGVMNKVDIPGFCPKRKEFDQDNFTARVATLLKLDRTAQESEVEINGQKWTQVRGKNVVHMLYYDFDNKRWFELSAYSHDLEKPEVKDFFASLRFDQKIKGISIKSGAKTTLGDDQTEVKPVAAQAVPAGAPSMLTVVNGGSDSSGGDSGGNRVDDAWKPAKEDENNKPVVIAMKPRPAYTESARRARINGTIRLRVTLLNNGSVGEITVINELPDGLTDEAIAAARRILFVPAKKDKVAISVTKVIEFGFSTY
jgi:TonB family protein